MKHSEDADLAILKIFEQDAPITDTKTQGPALAVEPYHVAGSSFGVAQKPFANSASDSPIKRIEVVRCTRRPTNLLHIPSIFWISESGTSGRGSSRAS